MTWVQVYLQETCVHSTQVLSYVGADRLASSASSQRRPASSSLRIGITSRGTFTPSAPRNRPSAAVQGDELALDDRARDHANLVVGHRRGRGTGCGVELVAPEERHRPRRGSARRRRPPPAGSTRRARPARRRLSSARRASPARRGRSASARTSPAANRCRSRPSARHRERAGRAVLVADDAVAELDAAARPASRSPASRRRRPRPRRPRRAR